MVVRKQTYPTFSYATCEVTVFGSGAVPSSSFKLLGCGSAYLRILSSYSASVCRDGIKSCSA